MKRRTRFRGDLQVDGQILGPDGQPIGGGSPDSRISLYNDGPQVLSNTADTYINTWVLDEYPDDDTGDIVLGDDHKTITVAGGGKLYLAQFFAQVGPSHGATSIYCRLIGANVQNGDGFAPSNFSLSNGVIGSAAMLWFFVANASQELSVAVRVEGASAPESLQSAGIDIVRLR